MYNKVNVLGCRFDASFQVDIANTDQWEVCGQMVH